MAVSLDDAHDRALARWQRNAAPPGYSEEWEKCKADIVYWLSTYGKTFDPRLPTAEVPFTPFPRQAEYLHWLTERYEAKEDGVVDKCRDAGVTWLTAAWHVHRWLFFPGFAGCFGSRKEDLVDKSDDPKTIFHKIRFLIDHCPDWQKCGYDEKKHSSHLKIAHPSNGSTITGEAGDNMGRGGRSSAYALDEFAFIDRPNGVDAAVSANSNNKIYISTHNGPGSLFAQKRFGGEYAVFEFDWTDDPRKTPEWYQSEKRKLDPATFAQEIDRDPYASVENVVIPGAWVKAAIGLTLTRPGVYVAGLDIAAGGKNKTVLTVADGPVVTKINVLKEKNTTTLANLLIERVQNSPIKQVNFDADGIGVAFESACELKELNFDAIPIHGGGEPSTHLWEMGKTSRQRFLNRRAESWWFLRDRFEKTFERVTLRVQHPDDVCIALPSHERGGEALRDLLKQLSSPTWSLTEGGKIKVESKATLKARGVESPDFADSLVYTFAHSRDEEEEVSNYEEASSNDLSGRV